MRTLQDIPETERRLLQDLQSPSAFPLLVIAVTKERFYERMASVLATVRDLSRGMPLSPLVLTPEELADRLGRGDQFVQEIVHSRVAL